MRQDGCSVVNVCHLEYIVRITTQNGANFGECDLELKNLASSSLCCHKQYTVDQVLFARTQLSHLLANSVDRELNI